MNYPAFVGGDNQAQARIANQERTVNLIVEKQESPGADDRQVMYSVPGMTLLATAMSSPGRGSFSESGREFHVIGTSLVEVDDSATITVRGSVATDSNPAQIRSNGDGGGQLLIVSGSNGYSYDLGTNVLTQVAALNGKARMCGFKDGYGLVLDNTTSTVYFSALNDFSSWTTGTDFFQRSLASDQWKAMTINNPYVPLLGELTSEFWYNAGGSSNPFAPDPSGQIPHGIAAPFSLAVGDGTLFWLAQSAIGKNYVVKTTGFQVEVISTLPLQATFNTYDVVADAQGEVVNYDGHVMYRLHFPSQDITWCYDLSTGQWLQWGTWITENNDFSAHRPRWPVVAFGEIRFLDSQTGAIYKLDRNVHTDVDSRPVVWERRPPVISSGGERLFHRSLEIFVQTGVGVTSGDAADVDPQIMLQYSNDGGANWSAEYWRSMGRVGEYDRRVCWEPLGSAFRRAYRVRGSAAVAVCIVGAGIEFGQTPKALRGVRRGQ
jgi:hypothetical protein